jgi:tetratricopeptide (TPR) repeat protein
MSDPSPLAATSTITGAELRKRRQTLGITLETLSIGICSTAYLSLIEQGHRQPSPRIAELLLARLTATAGEAGVAMQIASLRVAEWQIRQNTGLEAELRKSPGLRKHKLLLDALESEARDEPGTALAQLDTWQAEHEGSRDLKSFGGRIRVRLLRELGRESEALTFASELLVAAQQQIKSRQDDLLDIAFQTADMYSAAGLWRDALRVIEKHRKHITDPRQEVNARWAASNAFYIKGDFERALTEVNEALNVIGDLDLPAGEAKLITNAVWCELHAGIVDRHSQQARLDEAAAVLRTQGQSMPLALVSASFALLHAKLGDSVAFKLSAKDAIAVSTNINSRDHDELIVALAGIAVAHDEKPFAKELIERFDARTREIPHSRAEALILYRAGKVAEALGDFKRAFAYLDSSHTQLGFVARKH